MTLKASYLCVYDVIVTLLCCTYSCYRFWRFKFFKNCAVWNQMHPIHMVRIYL